MAEFDPNYRSTSRDFKEKENTRCLPFRSRLLDVMEGLHELYFEKLLY